MVHRKEKHPNKTKMCRYFLQDKCAFDGSICWFSHDQTNDSKGSLFPQILKEFKCSFCEQIFKNKSDFMQHRKHEHPKYVSECRENQNGSCKFDETCWYQHKDRFSYENESHQSPEKFERLFDMMEKYAERLEILDIQNVTKT